MKKTKLSKRTLALLAAALVLLAGGGYTGTRAVLNTFSDQHLLDIHTADVGIALVNADGSTMIADDNIVPGKEYAKNVRVVNNSDTDQFVRVVVRKYWMKQNAASGTAEKVTVDENLPADALKMLKFSFGTDGWKENTSEQTPERNVYYYTKALKAGDTSSVVINSFVVDPQVAVGTTTTTGNVTTITYKYNGYEVGIEVEAQSVQTHNGTDAIKSIWGVQNIKASGDKLDGIK